MLKNMKPIVVESFFPGTFGHEDVVRALLELQACISQVDNDGWYARGLACNVTSYPGIQKRKGFSAAASSKGAWTSKNIFETYTGSSIDLQ